jgi:hypothetical protein
VSRPGENRREGETPHSASVRVAYRRRHGPRPQTVDRRRDLPPLLSRRPAHGALPLTDGLRAVPCQPGERHPATRLALLRVLPDAEPLSPARRDAEARPLARNAAPELGVRVLVQRTLRLRRPRVQRPLQIEGDPAGRPASPDRPLHRQEPRASAPSASPRSSGRGAATRPPSERRPPRRGST